MRNGVRNLVSSSASWTFSCNCPTAQVKVRKDIRWLDLCTLGSLKLVLTGRCCFCTLVESMHSVVRILLRDLSTEGDENKRNLYQSCIQTGPSAHTWNVSASHLDSSSLIDQV